MSADVLQQILNAVRAVPAWEREPSPEDLAGPVDCPFDHSRGTVCPDEDCLLQRFDARLAVLQRTTWTEACRLADAHPETVDAVKGLRAALDACGAAVPEAERRALVRLLSGAVAPVAALSPDSWVDARTAADMLGVTVRTLRRWRDAGTAPPWTQVGSAVRFKVADLTGWMEAGRVGSTAEKAARGR